MSIPDADQMDIRQDRKGVDKGWAAFAVAIMLAIYTLAWVGRPLVNELQARGALPRIMAVVVALSLTVLALAPRWMGRVAKTAIAKALVIFAISQLLSFTITRTIAEAIHTVEYELLAISIYFALRPIYVGRELVSRALLLVLIAGWSDEIMQSFVPDRYYDLLDVLLNLVSGAFGLAIAIILDRGRQVTHP